jgi:hypothetical protein
MTFRVLFGSGTHAYIRCGWLLTFVSLLFLPGVLGDLALTTFFLLSLLLLFRAVQLGWSVTGKNDPDLPRQARLATSLLVIVTACFWVWLAPAVDRVSFWLDEWGVIDVAATPLPDLFRGVWGHAAAAPLDYLQMHLWVQVLKGVLGTDPFTSPHAELLLRLPYFVIHSIAATFFGWIGLVFFRRGWLWGFLSGLVYFSQAAFLPYAVEIRFYAAAGLFSALQLWLSWVIVFRKTSPKDAELWRGFGFVALLGLLNHVFHGFLVIALLLLIAYSRHRPAFDRGVHRILSEFKRPHGWIGLAIVALFIHFFFARLGPHLWPRHYLRAANEYFNYWPTSAAVQMVRFLHQETNVVLPEQYSRYWVQAPFILLATFVLFFFIQRFWATRADPRLRGFGFGLWIFEALVPAIGVLIQMKGYFLLARHVFSFAPILLFNAWVPIAVFLELVQDQKWKKKAELSATLLVLVICIGSLKAFASQVQAREFTSKVHFDFKVALMELPLELNSKATPRSLIFAPEHTPEKLRDQLKDFRPFNWGWQGELSRYEERWKAVLGLSVDQPTEAEWRDGPTAGVWAFVIGPSAQPLFELWKKQGRDCEILHRSRIDVIWCK